MRAACAEGGTDLTEDKDESGGAGTDTETCTEGGTEDNDESGGAGTDTEASTENGTDPTDDNAFGF